MDDVYGLHDMIGVADLSIDGERSGGGRLVDVAEFTTGEGGGRMSDLIKSRVSGHPLFPKLVSAFIQCQKVGAPAETVSVLEDISKDTVRISGGGEIGDDPELDDFMESYCEILHRFEEELSKPFNEATTFFTAVQSQLSHLCQETLTTATATANNGNSDSTDEAAGTSEEDLSGGELEAAACQLESFGIQTGDGDLKETLLNKYKGYFSNLRKEFLKKRKKGKLPKEAKNVLLNWWNIHYRWPYPTEEEKMRLSEVTGLGQKQISNWFINQRKRHWRPSNDIEVCFA